MLALVLFIVLYILGRSLLGGVVGAIKADGRERRSCRNGFPVVPVGEMAHQVYRGKGLTSTLWLLESGEPTREKGCFLK